jgi:hypothetical protein
MARGARADALAAEGDQRLRGDGGAQDYRGARDLAIAVGDHRKRRRLRDRGMVEQRLLDVGRIELDAVVIDQVVDATLEKQRALRRQRAERTSPTWPAGRVAPSWLAISISTPSTGNPTVSGHARCAAASALEM